MPETMRGGSKTAAEIAFEQSGLKIEEVARLIDVSPAYTRHLLRNGAKSHCTAERLRKVLHIRIELLLPSRNLEKQPQKNLEKINLEKRKEVSEGRPGRIKATV